MKRSDAVRWWMARRRTPKTALELALELCEKAGVRWDDLPGKLGVGAHYPPGWSIWNREHLEDLNLAVQGGESAVAYFEGERAHLEEILARYNAVGRILEEMVTPAKLVPEPLFLILNEEGVTRG